MKKTWEQPRQVNLLGTILCATQCETAGWGGLPGTLLPDSDCKLQGHFSTVWVVCCLHSIGQAAFHNGKSPKRVHGMKAQFEDHRAEARDEAAAYAMRCEVEPCPAHTNFG